MVLTNISQSSPYTAPGKAETLSPTPGVVIPVYASWFEFGKIHEIERRSLPEFFASDPDSDAKPATASHPPTNITVAEDKTPTAYVEYRDFMIQTYRLRPQDYLTITTCRRHLTGDVGGIVRVHSFLEQWGLINFQVVEGPAMKRDRPVQLGRQPVPVDLPMAISTAIKASTALEEATRLTRSFPAAAEQDGDAKPAATAGATVLCAQCSVECPRLYYSQVSSSTGAPSAGSGSALNLCGLCYAEGRYPSTLHSGDFVKVDVAALEQGLRLAWTDEETLQLLSAVEELGADWDAVAQRVGRPKDQCVFHFLRLPGIEALDAAPAAGDRLAEILPATGIPFTAVENPIMSTLAFLASAVHPKVAAAAAQAALAEIAKIKSGAAPQSADTASKAAPMPLDNEDLAKISATGLACAAGRAAVFAAEETRKATKLRDTLLDLQLQKVRVKLALFEALERGLEEDRKELEQQRLQLFFDRFNLRKQMLAIDQRASPSPTPPSARMEIDEGPAEQPPRSPEGGDSNGTTEPPRAESYTKL